ncbi:hypothetical protein Ciccas_006741 [Cichlidogyrus casuarinus]|uniref:Uncharacterized protein n=1 Tax=Cichlidogyrus casuarinus TaxID=1844966 RepID=A0ABD2Q7B9_9PLAT
MRCMPLEGWRQAGLNDRTTVRSQAINIITSAALLAATAAAPGKLILGQLLLFVIAAAGVNQQLCDISRCAAVDAAGSLEARHSILISKNMLVHRLIEFASTTQQCHSN